MAADEMVQTSTEAASRPTIFTKPKPLSTAEAAAMLVAEPLADTTIVGEIVAEPGRDHKREGAATGAEPSVPVTLPQQPQEARARDSQPRESSTRRDAEGAPRETELRRERRDIDPRREAEAQRREHEAAAYRREQQSREHRNRVDPYRDSMEARRVHREHHDHYARGPRSQNTYDQMMYQQQQQQQQQTGWLGNVNSFFGGRDYAGENQQLRKILQELEARETDLRNRLADAERRLVVVTRDLEESRSFVSKEDADARELIEGFNDVNEGANDLAYLISESLPKEILEQELISEGCAAASSIDETLSWLLKVARYNECTITDIIEPAVQHLTHQLLVQYVFSVWSPGMPENESTTLRNLYGHIQSKETQDRAARWRSMTYQSCHPDRDDAVLVSDVVTHFVNKLGAILDALLPPVPPPAKEDPPPTTEEPKPEAAAPTEDGETPAPPSTPPRKPTRAEDMAANFAVGFTNNISKLVYSAIRLQDKMRATYLSFDYMPYAARVGEYDRNHVETSDKISHWTHKLPITSQWAERGVKHGDMTEIVLAQTALGLRASKSVAKSQGTGMERQYKVVVRAKAIVGRLTFVKVSQPSSSGAPPANQE